MPKEPTLNTLDKKIDHLTEICSTNFTRMNHRFDKVEERLDDLEEDVGVLKIGVKALENKVEVLQEDVLEIKNIVSPQKRRVAVDI